MATEKAVFTKENPLMFTETGLFLNFAIKTVGRYDNHVVDTYGYVEYTLAAVTFD